jgi:hypothetical protein
VPTSDQVKVNVEYGLTRMRTRVENQAVSALIHLEYLRHPFTHQNQFSDQFSVAFREGIDGINVLFGNDQDVDRSDRFRILENHDFLILGIDLGRMSVARNLAKNAGIYSFHTV